MDAKEIVKALREHAEWAQANEWECPITLGDDLRKAADTIEELNDFQGSQCAKLLAQLSELRAENARLRAERDKAVEDLNLTANCDVCKHYDADEISCAKPTVDSYSCFEWRGSVAGEESR